MMIRFLVILFAVTCFFAAPALADTEKEADIFNSTSLPLPRFVSIKSDKAYVRAGPAVRYPVKWVFKRKNLPVEIVQEFDHWRKVRDSDGDEGWVHKMLLSGERTVLIQRGEQNEGLTDMREGFSRDSRLVARLETGVIASVKQCIEDWCRLEKDGYTGWVERNFLWGIYEGEELN